MHVFHSVDDFPISGHSSVAIGNFDGVHLGHTALLRNLVEHSRRAGTTSLVLTFYPHPVEILKPGTQLLRLTTTTEKLVLIEGLGVECVLVQPFDKELAALDAQAFFDTFLIRKLKAKSIHVGDDFMFGKGRSGTLTALGKMCQDSGAATLVVEPGQTFEGKRVSSTLIRKLLSDGELILANRLLGRPYSLEGPILPGEQEGHAMGFPTANLKTPFNKLLPRPGVYITETTWQRQKFRSVTNIGVRPTISNAGKLTVETHILDFHSQLYDEVVSLAFLAPIRPERKFESRDALIAQIKKDIEYAKNYKGLTGSQ